MGDSHAPTTDAIHEGEIPEVSTFVSYERSCRNLVISLAASLDGMRVPARGDWQLTPGEDWWERIADLIRGSDTFLFLITPESVRSPACLRELDLALSWHKRILPVVRQKPIAAALTELPEVLAKEQWVFFRAEDDPNSALQSIAVAVRTDFELAIVHTRLAVWTDAWERGVGDLLRGGYLAEAEATLQRMAVRERLLPSATPKMERFVEESRKTERKRKRRFTFLAVTAVVIAGLLGGIAWQKKRLADSQTALATTQTALAKSERARGDAQQKIAHLEQLQRQGESAVTAVKSGDIPAAVLLLENVVTNDPARQLPSYHLIHRFLRPLLVPEKEVISNLPRPAVFRWRGQQYVLLQDGTFLPISGAAVELFAVTNAQKYLITADVARSVCIFRLSTFSKIQCFPVADARIDGIYEKAESGALAVAAHELYLASDEDDPTAEAVGDAFMVVLRQPAAKPQVVKGEQFAPLACGADKDQPCGYRRLPGLGTQDVPSVTFPSLRPEREYWRTIAAADPMVPADWHSSPSQQFEAKVRRLDKLDFSGARQPASAFQIKNGDELIYGFSSFFKLGDSEYLTTQVVIGNQAVMLYLCRIGSGNKVLECWKTELTAVTREVFAPDFRYLASWATEVQYGFKILQLPTLKACDRIDGPGERAVAGGFTPDGNLFAVASKDGELWIYSLGSECNVTLQRKIFSPQLAKRSSAVALSFVSEKELIVAYGNTEIAAYDTTTGVLKWTRSGFGSKGGIVSVTASPNGELLAACTSDEVQLIHAETGIPLSGTFGFSSSSASNDKITRVVWQDDSVIVERADEMDAKKPRVLRRRISPAEAESQYLRGIPTPSLTTLSAPQDQQPSSRK
jgi:hypothetical protein